MSYNLTVTQLEVGLDPALIPLDSRDGAFWACGLAGELGEVCNIVKKIERDGVTDELLYELSIESGDVLFYLRQVLHKYGLTMVDAGIREMNKLDQIRKQGSIH